MLLPDPKSNIIVKALHHPEKDKESNWNSGSGWCSDSEKSWVGGVGPTLGSMKSEPVWINSLTFPANSKFYFYFSIACQIPKIGGHSITIWYLFWVARIFIRVDALWVPLLRLRFFTMSLKRIGSGLIKLGLAVYGRCGPENLEFEMGQEPITL